jgi:BON domain
MILWRSGATQGHRAGGRGTNLIQRRSKHAVFEEMDVARPRPGGATRTGACRLSARVETFPSDRVSDQTAEAECHPIFARLSASRGGGRSSVAGADHDESDGSIQGELAVMIEGEDERIQGDVSDRLAAELLAQAAQIQVDVQHGEVTLAGTVDTSEARRQAENVAGSIAGVVSVMNNLRVRQPGGTGATG